MTPDCYHYHKYFTHLCYLAFPPLLSLYKNANMQLQKKVRLIFIDMKPCPAFRIATAILTDPNKGTM